MSFRYINMEALYHQTNGVIQEIQQCFQLLNQTVGDNSSVENAILTKIAAVNAYVLDRWLK